MFSNIKIKISPQRLFLGISLFVLALVVRLTYLTLALAQTSLDEIIKCSVDTGVYFEIAEHFLSGNLKDADYLIQVGPGYGFILACVQKFIGVNLIWPIYLNIILGSIAVVLIYIIAYKLMRSTTAAVIAGVVCAFSPTSISLSCNILSDQPYFTFQVAAILLFVIGYLTGKRRYFCIHCIFVLLL